MPDTAAVLRRYVWIPISALLLAFVIWRTRPWEIAELGVRVDGLTIAVVVLLNGAVILLWAIRSAALMAGVGYPLPLRALVPLVSFANTIGNLTPASAGEALRALILRDRYGVPLTRSTAVILAERLWAIGIMALSAGAAALVTIGHLPAAPAAAIWGAAIVACFLPTVAYRGGIRPGRLLERWNPQPTAGRVGRLVAGLVELDQTMAGLVGDPRRAAVFVVTTAGIFSCYAAQLALLLAMLGQPLSLDASWGALGLATVAGVLSALPFGLGAADAVLAVLLGSLGIGTAVIGAVVLLLRATATLPLGICGALSWSVLGRPATSNTEEAGSA